METAVAKQFEGRRGDFLMLPYDPKFGIYNEESMVTFYDRLRTEDLLSTVFHENPEMSLREFLNFFNVPMNLLQVFSITEGDKVLDIAGLAWLADIVVCQGVLTRALGSFVFFRKYQSPKYTDQFSQIILDYWFNILKIDTIVGVTPAENRLAILYVKRAGFREVGRIPAYTTLGEKVMDGIITCMTRGEYLVEAGG
jgi:RimJ/RimL family protein N-acetyltransferase